MPKGTVSAPALHQAGQAKEEFGGRWQDSEDGSPPSAIDEEASKVLW